MIKLQTSILMLNCLRIFSSGVFYSLVRTLHVSSWFFIPVNSSCDFFLFFWGLISLLGILYLKYTVSDFIRWHVINDLNDFLCQWLPKMD